VLIPPAVIFIALLVGGPLVLSVYLSLTNATAGATSANGGASSSSAASPSTASSSTAFITIQNLGSLEVVASFPEADATKIAPGQPASVTLSALTNSSIAGTVTNVSSTSTVVSNVVTYDVTIALTNPPKSVKLGMTADVSVYVDTQTNVLTLPSAAITTVGSQSTVTLLRNGKTSTQAVTTGLVGSSTTQIVSGLNAGDVVVVPTVTVSAATGNTATAGSSGSLSGGGGGFPGGGGGFVRPGG